MTQLHPNLSEHYGAATDLGDLTHRLTDVSDHIALASALYDATALPPIELRRVLRGLARREGGATTALAHEMASRRLRALLNLDDEEARVIARAFEDAFVDLPIGWRERNREIEFAVIKNALHLREFGQLVRVLPWLRETESAQWLLARLDESKSEAPESQQAELLAIA